MANMATTTAASSPPPSARTMNGIAANDTATPSQERPSDWLERRREIEHRSRQKRKQRFQSMPAQVAQLERAALAVRLASDPDAAWDEFLDEETKHLRDTMRQLMTALSEARRLNAEKVQLRRLVKEQELVWRTVANLMKQMETTDDWDASDRRWRALTRCYFRPLTPEQCFYQMNRVMAEMTRFMTSHDRLSSGLTFMGWRDSRRMVRHESCLQFDFHKKFQGNDLTKNIDISWRLFKEQELYSRLVMRGRAQVSMEVLQELSPTAVVVRISESYEGLPVTFHEVFLVFLVPTKKGFIQYSACLHDADLQAVINKPNDMWANNSYWIRWEIADPTQDQSAADYEFSMGGSIRGNDPLFLHRWMCELLAAVIRVEGEFSTRPMLQF